MPSRVAEGGDNLGVSGVTPPSDHEREDTMSLIRRIARPLIAAPFILEGVRTALHPEREIDVAPAAFGQVDKALANTSVPKAVDARAIVRGAGVVAAGAGIMYATNRAPRLSAALLLVTTSVGIANRKKVWELRGEERVQEIQSILTDAGLLGGVLLAVADTDGNPSVGYRVNRLVERGQKSAAKKQRELEKSAGKLGRKVKKSDTRKKAEEWQKSASKAFDHAAKSVHDQLG